MILWILYSPVFFIIIPVILGLTRYRRLEVEQKWLVYMLAIITLNQWVSAILGLNRMNNYPLYHFYIVLEVVCLTKIFSIYLKETKGITKIWIVPVIFILAFLGNLIYDSNQLYNSPDDIRALESLIILSLSSVYFVNVFKRQEILFLHKSSGFWFGAGLIVYFASNLMLFTFNKLVLLQGKEIALYIWSIHAVLNILLYISYSIALLCRKTETIS